MSDSKVDIVRHKLPLLGPTNYFIWSRKIELLLRGKGLWAIVEGSEDAPTGTGVDGAITEKDQCHYQRRKDVALSDILLTIEDRCTHAVLKMEEPHEVWMKLKEMYQAVSSSCIEANLERLHSLQMKSKEKVMTYVNRLMSIENSLAAVGHALTEKDRIRALLKGLRSEFDVTAKVIRVMNQSFSQAVADLVTEEGTLQGRVSTDPNAVSLIVRGSTSGKNANSNRKLTCDHCGRPGHTKEKCFHNPRGQAYKPNYRSSRRNQADTTPKEENSDKGSEKAMVVSATSMEDAFASVIFKNKWIADSGCTSHFCNKRESFFEFEKRSFEPVSIGDGKMVEVKGIGKVRGTTVINGRVSTIVFKNVLYAPTMMCNLVSVSKARKSGFRVVFDVDSTTGFVDFIDKQSSKSYLRGIERTKGLYDVLFMPNAHSCMLTIEANKWHLRLGHVSYQTINKTRGMTHGITEDYSTPEGLCDACEVSKSCRKPRPAQSEEAKRSTGALELVHTDVVGPMNVPSLGGSKYFLTLYDDATSYSIVRFMKERSDVPELLKEMILELEQLRKKSVSGISFSGQLGSTVARLRSDNAREYLSKDLLDWFKSRRIRHELSSPYSPESNGKCESPQPHSS